MIEYAPGMRVALSALVLSACATTEPARPTTIPQEPMSCDARYTGETSERADDDIRAHVLSLVERARSGTVTNAVDVTSANVVDLATTGLARAQIDLDASFTETLRYVPIACSLEVFLEPSRLDIPPPFQDTPPDQVAPIEVARALLVDAEQVVVTCDGCPMIAIAFLAEGDAPPAFTWAILGRRLPH